MLIAALFIITKIRKEPKCPQTDEWIKKMWCWDFPGSPVVENMPSDAGDPGSIPGQVTKILHASGQLSPCDTTTEPACSTAWAPQLKKTTHCKNDPAQPKKKKDVVHIDNGIVLSHKKDGNNAIYSKMNGLRYDHAKRSKSERGRQIPYQIPYDITYLWNVKYDTNEFMYKTETDSQT